MALALDARKSSGPGSDAGVGRKRASLGLQAALLAAVALIPLHPPAQGAMILLPLNGADRGSTLAWASAAGALPLGPGPFPGAMVVRGARSALIGPALAHATLVLAAGSAGCSVTPKAENDE